jgi:hypothetical protein
MELLRGRKVLLPASVEPPRIHKLNPGTVVCLNVELQGGAVTNERVRASTWDECGNLAWRAEVETAVVLLKQ